MKERSNSTLVSGGSGVGKTGIIRMLMRYPAHLGGKSGVKGRIAEQ